MHNVIAELPRLIPTGSNTILEKVHVELHATALRLFILVSLNGTNVQISFGGAYLRLSQHSVNFTVHAILNLDNNNLFFLRYLLFIYLYILELLPRFFNLISKLILDFYIFCSN